MKKVLILAYDFPPLNSAGAQRPLGWFLYFKENDLHPIIFTRKWEEGIKNEIDAIKPCGVDVEHYVDENGEVYNVPFKPNMRDKLLIKYGFDRYGFLRKFLTVFYSVFPFICIRLSNLYNLYYEANKYLQQNRIDVIIASGGPFILFKFAMLLSKSHKVPWLADYRDLWTFYPQHNKNVARENFEKIIHRYFEKKIVKSASTIITVTKPLVDILKKEHLKEVVLSMNGFFPFECNNNDVLFEKDNVFKIAYSGTIYPYFDLDGFFEAYNDFIVDKDKRVELCFFGLDYSKEQKENILKICGNSKNTITFTEKLPNIQLLEKLSHYQLLLLLGKENGISIHIKTFEYISLNKPILFFAKNNRTIADIIENAHAGCVCETKDEVFEVLTRFYDEFCKNGNICHQTKQIMDYSRAHQTKILTQYINERF